MILDTFPAAEEFYKTYWGKRPFIVRGYIPPALIESLVDGDTLAGLALEEEIKSRIITNSEAGGDWVCEHGPFEEERFSDLDERNWSLLVQNVEQYHTDTAELLSHFQFSPRWLMDDIMVSYSAPGGSVGPHTDSYHTFLVQGIGRRSWKISADPVYDDRYVDNPDVKVLEHGFKGETFEVEAGDVIYMPPFFGHEGKTLETGMTFSVGFLGPKLSEILSEYAHYLEENEPLNKRYLGEGLNIGSAGFTLATRVQNAIRDNAVSSLQSDDFSVWLAAYFSAPTHSDIEDMAMTNKTISTDALFKALQGGAVLYRPEHVKLSVTTSSKGRLHLAVYGESIAISSEQGALIEQLNSGQDITREGLDSFGDQGEVMILLTDLYHRNTLFLRVVQNEA